MKIALCDDESAQLARAETLLREYGSLRSGMELSLTAFSSGTALLEHSRFKGVFDIYLLDIIMPEQNGVELGLSIREFDRNGHIVYLTSSPDYAVDSYRTRASDYLLKPLDKNRLFSTLDGITEDITRERQEFVTIKTKEGLRRIPLHRVVYGELVSRCVRYHLSDGSVIESMSLRGSFQSAVAPLLENRRFVLCAASFVVNLYFVELIGSSTLRLTGGGTLPVSRMLRKKVTSRWLDYHLEGGR